jgi:hypothetical protein
LNCGPELLSPFLQQISFLHNKLGPVLIGLEFDRAIAKRFLSLLRKNYAGDGYGSRATVVGFMKRPTTCCRNSISRGWLPIHRAFLPQPSLADSPAFFISGFTVLRMSDYSEYSRDFLKGLAAQLADLATNTEVWCVFDNPAAGFAVRNTLELTAKLRNGHETNFLAHCGDGGEVTPLTSGTVSSGHTDEGVRGT